MPGSRKRINNLYDKTGRRAYGRKKKKLSLEEAFEKLETVIETLERPETSLEESFQAYKEGVSLVQLCNEQIDRVEKEVRVLSQEGEADEQL